MVKLIKILCIIFILSLFNIGCSSNFDNLTNNKLQEPNIVFKVSKMTIEDMEFSITLKEPDKMSPILNFLTKGLGFYFGADILNNLINFKDTKNTSSMF